MSRSRLSLLLLLVPALMASRCKEKDEEPDEIIEIQELDPNSVLQVASIDPAWGEALRPFKATVYGAGFKDGARVSFGMVQAAKVTFRDANTLIVAVPPLDAGSVDITVRNPDGGEATLRRGLTITEAKTQVEVTVTCDALTVGFEFDSSSLTGPDRSKLDEIVPCLAKRSDRILLEGHCDSRGTTEYNLALGQRRAESVKDYLIGQGISPDRIRTVSYGEERPIARGGTEEAMAQNRRVELKAGR